MYWGEGGIYLWYMAKVVYTVWGIYHTKFDIYEAIKVAMRYVLTASLHGTSEGPTAVQYCSYQSHFQVEVAQTIIIAIYRLLWHDATWITDCDSGTGHWQDREFWLKMLSESRLLCGHLVALQVYFKFTSACVALVFLQVPNQRIKFWTTDCSPLITNISPK